MSLGERPIHSVEHDDLVLADVGNRIERHRLRRVPAVGHDRRRTAIRHDQSFADAEVEQSSGSSRRPPRSAAWRDTSPVPPAGVSRQPSQQMKTGRPCDHDFDGRAHRAERHVGDGTDALLLGQLTIRQADSSATMARSLRFLVDSTDVSVESGVAGFGDASICGTSIGRQVCLRPFELDVRSCFGRIDQRRIAGQAASASRSGSCPNGNLFAFLHAVEHDDLVAAPGPKNDAADLESARLRLDVDHASLPAGHQHGIARHDQRLAGSARLVGEAELGRGHEIDAADATLAGRRSSTTCGCRGLIHLSASSGS